MADTVLVKNFKVLNKCGIHARPAAQLAGAAGKYDCDISIEKDGYEVSCKSIMGLLTMEGTFGSTMRVTASGADAPEAMAEIEALFVNKFDED